MDSLAREVRGAARRLRKTPGFTLVALVTLALGIGANTALFSVVHAVLLRALPFKEPDGLYWVWSRHTSTDRYPFQVPEFCDYRDQNKTMDALAGFANWSANLTGDGPAERLSGLRVSDNFFDLLGAGAAVGRTLRPGDDTPGQEKVVVLSYGLWQRRFGGDAGVVGSPLTLNGEPFTVIGVLPREFFYPNRDIDLAIPLAPDKDPWRQNRDSTNFIRILGRARPGVTHAQIADDLNAIAVRLQKEFPESYVRKKGIMAVPYHEELTRNFSQALIVLLAAVALLLLIACANLANLMLVRATGAGRWRSGRPWARAKPSSPASSWSRARSSPSEAPRSGSSWPSGRCPPSWPSAPRPCPERRRSRSACPCSSSLRGRPSCPAWPSASSPRCGRRGWILTMTSRQKVAAAPEPATAAACAG